MTNTSASPTRFAYRPDIDGLRAIAVLAVVLFHLGISQLEGGFLGVDVFFVISGYLITSIIAPKIVAGTFSFKAFYLKRVRRLIPPALVTIAVTFIFSAFILDPTDLINMAESAIAAVFSVSNVLFFTEAGYWDAQSELKPLLHTWSLGVEEQFYLFWPILVLVFWKLMPRRNPAWAFGIATLIGLVVSEWMLRVNPTAAFYLLPARFFEFSIGATFAFIGKSDLYHKLNSSLLSFILGLVSLVVLLATIWLYRGDMPFPGINAILPCLATALLMLSGEGATGKTLMGTLLGNPVMTWIGRVSYSLYLVHWPIVSLMRYDRGLHLTPSDQLLAVALTILFTLVLYYGIEKRFSSRAGQGKRKHGSDTQSKAPMSSNRFAIFTGMTAIAFSSVYAHAALNSGWTWRYEAISFTPEQLRIEKDRRFTEFGGSCLMRNFPDGNNCRNDAKLNVLVLGNSHETDAFNFFNAAYGSDPELQLIRFQRVNNCDFRLVNGAIGAYGPREDCPIRLESLLDSDKIGKVQIVVYSSKRPFEIDKVAEYQLLKAIKETNPDVKIITMGSYVNVIPKCVKLINETGGPAACMESEYVDYVPNDDPTGALYADVMGLTDYFLNKADLLCVGQQPEGCESETPDRIPFSYDNGHLSLQFAKYAGKKFERNHKNLLRELAGLVPQ